MYFRPEDVQRANDVKDVLTQELSKLMCDPVSLKLTEYNDEREESGYLQAAINVTCPLRSRIPDGARQSKP
jgi:hypothetical protein